MLPVREDDTLPLPRSRLDADPAPGLPRYQVLEEVARGGMGAVLRVHDPMLDRTLALKVLLAEHLNNSEMRARFLDEARIAGRLQHPGVPPIHDLGELPDGRPYFAMKLIHGQTLAELLEGRSSPEQDQPRLVAVFEQVCATVAYAHSQGVIHRDLKPANVMVGNFSEVQVMDWGVAKVLGPTPPKREAVVVPLEPTLSDDLTVTLVRTPASVPRSNAQTAPASRWSTNSELTQAGSVLGTPAYMAPEQARGEVELVDERADVFGLGAILCEVLTGQPPYRWPRDVALWLIGEDRDLHDAHDRLQQCGADAELVRLACDCLAAEPAGRPRNAAAVAQRVSAYQTGVQERLHRAELERAAAQARLAEARQRGRAERRARRLLVGLALMTLLLAGLGVAARWWWWQRQQDTRHQVEMLLAQSQNLADQAEKMSPGEQALTNYHDAAGLVEQALHLVKVAPGGAVMAEQVRDQQERIRTAADAMARQVRAEQERIRLDADARKRDKALVDRLMEIRTQKEDGYEQADTAGRYRAAFAGHDLDVDRTAPAELARRIRARPPAVVRDIVAALDDWSSELRRLGRPVAEWLPLSRLAGAVDDNTWRNDLRRLVEPGADALDRSKRRQALLELARRADLEQLPPASVTLLARQLLQHGERAEAVRLLRAAVARHPDDVWLNYDLAFILANQPRPDLDEAIRYYSAARALRPEVGHSLAHALFNRGRYDEAIALFRELIRLRPNNLHHLHCLGACLFQLQRIDELEAVCRAVLRVDPRSSSAWANLGQVLKHKRQDVEAEKCFREAIKLSPSAGPPWTGLGEVQARQGTARRPDAEASLSRGVTLSPRDPHARFALALRLTEWHRPDEAIRVYTELIALAPGHAEGHVNLAVLLKSRDAKKAQALLERAVQLRGDLWQARYHLGSLLASRGNYPASLPHLESALRLQPNDLEVRTNLASALASVGRTSEAIAHFEQILSREPQRAPAAFSLGGLYARLGHFTEAICWYHRSLKERPEHAETCCNLGLALRDAGLFTEARAAIQHGHDLGTRRGNWPYPSPQWLGDVDRLIKVESQLDDLVTGKRPATGTNQRMLAVHALALLGRHDDSVRMLDAALAADPKLGKRPGVLNWRVAIAMALRAAQAEGAAPDAARRTELYRKALRWLGEEVAWARRLLVSGAAEQKLAQHVLHLLVGDAQLASLLAPPSLARLPRDEQGRFAALWNEAQRLGRAAQALNAP
jgi:serine/threonine-protein kinase